ncbi:hypothetical protein BLX24_11215 [Arsenicibacter rosenii]|uniref:UDP-N-acetylglucosamine 2-epimerase domain-containing protein n=2 Tax=Arsenicibacter rosenii TaxID=1750698 RepID=A0A1S2VLX1_9BACT|nr:hypothetical protein BLX24_11215 [Arsenicibacter rosenii]
MRNLFVCHTQANLILAIGLAKIRFQNQKNDLILFKDFNLNEQTEKAVRSAFTNVLIRKGSYPSSNNKWYNKLPIILNDLVAINKFITDSYDKVFEVCDTNIQEMYILKKLYKKNKHIEMIWLEDGSFPYFKNTENVDGFNSNDITRALRKLIIKYIFQFGKIYNFNGNYISSNKNLTKIYLTLKGKERDIFRGREIIQIHKEEYLKGVTSLYLNIDESLQMADCSIVIALDKIDTIKNIDTLVESIQHIKEYSSSKKNQIYYKLHPKEEYNLEVLNDLRCLNKDKGLEYYLSSFKDKNVKVVGYKSTILMSARVLDIKVISLTKLIGDYSHELTEFYDKIGVDMPDNLMKLQSLLSE